MHAGDIDESYPPRRSPAAHTEVLDGEAVILDAQRRRLHRLNTTATAAWEAFDGRSTVSEVAADLAQRYGEDVETTTRDVLVLCRSLAAEGLLDGVERETGAELPAGDEPQPGDERAGEQRR